MRARHQLPGLTSPASNHLHSSNIRSRVAAGGGRGSASIPLPHVSRRAAAQLPGRDFDLAIDFGRLLEARSSIREFELRPLELEKLGRLLYATYGVAGTKQVDGLTAYARPAPSAGGLYPLEVYVVCQPVDQLPVGLYHDDARAHELEQRRLGSLHAALANLTIGQDMIRDAVAVIVITAIFHRTMWRYGQCGYRYVWLDAGHLAQNAYLVARALGLRAVSIGGFFDRQLDELLLLPADEHRSIPALRRPPQGLRLALQLVQRSVPRHQHPFGVRGEHRVVRGQQHGDARIGGHRAAAR